MEKQETHPPFDRLRANGSGTEIGKDFPFVLSLSKHERRSPATSHLGKLYMHSPFSFSKEEAEVKVGKRVSVRFPPELNNEITEGLIIGIAREDSEYVLLVKWDIPPDAPEETFNKNEYIEYLARWEEK